MSFNDSFICRIKDFGKKIYKKYHSVNIKVRKTVNFAIGISITAVLFNANFSLVYGVSLNGTYIGNIAQKSIAEAAVNRINEQYAPYYDGLDAVEGMCVYSLKFVKKSDILKEEELCENIKKASGTMTKQTVIEVDGNDLAGVLNYDEAEKALDICKQRFSDENTEECSIASNVKIEEKYAPSKLLSGAERAADRLIDNDYFDSLKVLTVEYKTYENEIPFEVERIEDDSAYEGSSVVKTEGENGIEVTVRKIERINGGLKSDSEVSKTVEKAPSNQVLSVGTKPRPSGVGTGNFSVPYNGNITSRYGQRSMGNHKGVDIVGPVGSPIYASDEGIVTYADYEDGGYGNIVKIDHQNGYETYYAHCSEILVKKGDTVKKGDLIAKVGNTGRSTGPHLHFEIRKNGETQNPLDYIG